MKLPSRVTRFGVCLSFCVDLESEPISKCQFTQKCIQYKYLTIEINFKIRNERKKYTYNARWQNQMLMLPFELEAKAVKIVNPTHSLYQATTFHFQFGVNLFSLELKCGERLFSIICIYFEVVQLIDFHSIETHKIQYRFNRLK